MSLPVVLRDEARAEFDESFDFYDARQVGLGPAFAAEVQRTLDRVAANPLLHQVVLADVRKAVVRRFPFVILYRPHSDRVEVLSVFHTSRDPRDWQRRV